MHLEKLKKPLRRIGRNMRTRKPCLPLSASKKEDSKMNSLQQLFNEYLHESEKPRVKKMLAEWLTQKRQKFNNNGKDKTLEQAINETNYQRTKRHIRNQFIKELLEELREK
jgi:glutamate synthase domain-containing protein 3